jgi:hypothetical protein
MTAEQIQAVKQSDEVEEAAMVFVLKGDATLIEFSRDHIIGQCGKERRNLEQSSADEGGGWGNVADLIKWESIADDLLCDGPVIVPGTMKDDAVVSFLEQMQSALAAVIRNKDDMEADSNAVEEDLEQ